MKHSHKPHTPPSAPDGDGVRIIRRESPDGRSRRRAPLLALALVIGVGAGSMLLMPQIKTTVPDSALPEMRAEQLAVVEPDAPRRTVAALPRAARHPPTVVFAQETPADYELPSMDPDDLSHYISPDEPVPTMAEVITALHDAGIHEGLGAFNPPGTSPPLEGLAVPDDFALPEGYVRHHQVSDDGEPIEAILMFSPDFEFYDESGNLVEIPPDRVVPPELAPPGMPIVQVQIPSP